MPKKITIRFDGDHVTVDAEGYAGMTCLEDLKALNLSLKVEEETPQPSRGVLIGQQRKTAI